MHPPLADTVIGADGLVGITILDLARNLQISGIFRLRHGLGYGGSTTG